MKRALTPVSPLSEQTSKKAKVEDDSPSSVPSLVTMKPPGQLLISVLVWDGKPTTICADGESLVDYVGSYKSAATSTLNLQGWDVSHQSFKYVPSSRPLEFPYKRQTFIGSASSDITYYGTFAGEDMSPKIRVYRFEQNPWPETFKTDGSQSDAEKNEVGKRFLLAGTVPDLDNRPLTGPPFHFFEGDLVLGLHPDSLGQNVVQLERPDLPGQTAFDDPEEEEGCEADSTEGLGWRGPYVEALLVKQKRKEHLVGRDTETRWSYDRSWAIDVKLTAQDIYEIDPEEFDSDESESSPAISGYSVLATIERIFVTQKYFETEGFSTR